MAEPTKIYYKFNSFVEMSHADSEEAQALMRVDALLNNLDELNLDESIKKVVKQACETLLLPQENLANPQFKLESYITQEILHQKEEDLSRYLYYRYRYETNFQNYILDEFPPSVQVEVASICNYRCVFCYQTDSALTDPKNEHMGLMSVDLFKQVIDELEGNCDQVTIASRGEPLINRHISEMLAYTAGKFVAFKINTNAWFLDEKKESCNFRIGCKQPCVFC
jgi:sulfatase maturation enzyme AslB (radical SAM superfamily)